LIGVTIGVFCRQIKKRLFHGLVLCGFVFSGGIAANQNDTDLALENLIKLLNTTIATGHFEQPSDLAPGIVTILDRDRLLATGVRTVYEALSLLPGFDIPQPQLADNEPVVRGIGGVFSGSGGRMRYMVNGIGTNNAISGNGSLILQLTVDQIERIEVISGPGASVYGEYAMLGVINVATRKQ
jgi:outer membrane receptor for ferrienterochelin and colicins